MLFAVERARVQENTAQARPEPRASVTDGKVTGIKGINSRDELIEGQSSPWVLLMGG